MTLSAAALKFFQSSGNNYTPLKFKPVRLLLLPLAFYLFGCSTTYYESDFTSHDKFVEDFNSFAADKKLEVTLSNDSTFTVLEGSRLYDDTLTVVTDVKKEQKIVSSDIIKKIVYNKPINYADVSGYIILNNGEIIPADGINNLSGSSIKFNKVIQTIKRYAVTDVEKVKYKNRWLGIVPGFLIGIPVGFFAGILAGSAYANNTQEGDDKASSVYLKVWSAVPLAGSTIGWLIGWDYIYSFNL